MRQVKKVLAAALLVVMWSTSAQAELRWFTAQIDRAGKISTGVVLIQLTDTKAVPTFTSKWFRAKSGVLNEMLAVALAALTADMLVSVQVDLDLPPAPQIMQLYLKK